MQIRWAWFRKALDAIPGRKTFGVYRFLPLFFALGAGLEFSMINWTFGGQVNFCEMPAGVSWAQYLKFSAAALLSMFAGAQTVHAIYRPLDDMDKYVQQALSRQRQMATQADNSSQKNSQS